MDPLLILFGFGVGVLVGMTGMGGGSLMTPLLVLFFGVKPTLAVGTDIAYQAITKTVGGYKHWKLKTVNFGAVLWLAIGSVPGSILGVQVVNWLQDAYGDDVETFTLVALGVVLALVGVFTLVRSIFYPSFMASEGQPHVQLSTPLKVTAIAIGLTTGFVIGITSAGSGTVIAVALIAIFKLPPRYVVGTDVFQAAILLWAAGLAHWAGGSIDFGLMGTLLIGSLPGVYLGSHFSVKVPEASLRTALGTVLMLSAAATLNKAGVDYVPNAILVIAVVFFAGVLTAIIGGRLANPWASAIRLTTTDGVPDLELGVGEPGDPLVAVQIVDPAANRQEQIL
ncbi:MAG: sulfite exporter TauE/SafE family protein [Solirubrobacterales bacterium]